MPMLNTDPNYTDAEEEQTQPSTQPAADDHPMDDQRASALSTPPTRDPSPEPPVNNSSLQSAAAITSNNDAAIAAPLTVCDNKVNTEQLSQTNGQFFVPVYTSFASKPFGLQAAAHTDTQVVPPVRTDFQSPVSSHLDARSPRQILAGILDVPRDQVVTSEFANLFIKPFPCSGHKSESSYTHSISYSIISSEF